MTAIVKFQWQAGNVHAVGSALCVRDNGRRFLLPHFKEIFNVWPTTFKRFSSSTCLMNYQHAKNPNYVDVYADAYSPNIAMQQMSINHLMDIRLSKPIEGNKNMKMHSSSTVNKQC
jgi:hypothetical protein